MWGKSTSTVAVKKKKKHSDRFHRRAGVLLLIVENAEYRDNPRLRLVVLFAEAHRRPAAMAVVDIAFAVGSTGENMSDIEQHSFLVS